MSVSQNINDILDGSTKMDDKLAVIISVTLLTLCAMWTFDAGSETIVTAAISGLFGIAIGKKL